MPSRRLLPIILWTLIMGLGPPVAAQSDLVFLGSLPEVFVTLSASGELVYPGELDWYAFDVIGDESLLFIVAETAGEDDVVRTLLFDADGVFIDAAQDGYLETTLVRGAYHVRIDSPANDAASYTLTISNGIETESNDGLIESDDAGDVTGPIRLFGALSPAGDVDFFRFRIPENGLPGDANAIIVETGGAEYGDTAIVLYQFDSDRGYFLPVAFDDDSGSLAWSRLLLRPDPGALYAVRVEETVYPLMGIDAYWLLINPVVLRADDEPNDTFATASALVPASADAAASANAAASADAAASANAAAWTVDGLLSGDDVIDVYGFELKTVAFARLHTEPQPGLGEFDTQLAIYDAAGALLAENDDDGGLLWSRIAVPLEAGEYFITVESYGLSATSMVPYRVVMTTRPLTTASETEPNDTDATSELVDWVRGAVLLIDAAIDPDGDVDSFRIVLDEETAMMLETGPRTGSLASFDTTLAVYDEDLWEIAYNDDAVGSWSRIAISLPAGTYYVVVKGYFSDDAFDYTLLISEADATP